MQILIGLVLVALGVVLWTGRARRAGDLARDLADLPAEARAAARRWNFKRQTDLHPVEGIEDPRLAIAGLASAFLALDDLPTREARDRMDAALQSQLSLNAQEAEELAILGGWFVRECGGADPAATRLSRRLYRLDQGASLPTVLSILNTIAGEELSPRQADALEDIQRAFRLT